MQNKFLSAALLAAGLLSPLASADVTVSFRSGAALPQPVATALGSGDFAALQARITESLRQHKLSRLEAHTLQLAMLHELIRETGADVMTRFYREPALTRPADVMAFRNVLTPEQWNRLQETGMVKSQQQFMQAFCADPEWQRLYLGAGLVPYRTDVGLSVLWRIWVSCDGQVRNKALASALASVWGGGETMQNPEVQRQDPHRFNPVRRYHFFERQQKLGKLHPNYVNLRPWELRFVVGIPRQDWDDASFDWAAENINLPWDQYHNACWAAVYTDPSRFGSTVYHGEFNLPYYTMAEAKTTHLNGGVCGALSHLGTYAAMAHGIPAYTAIQPGHCCYAVRPERGKWVGGFAGPDGYMHNYIFGDVAPTSFNLMEAVFGDDKAVETAYLYSYLARAAEAAGYPWQAFRLWQTALRHCPLHPFFRKAFHKIMMDTGFSPVDCLSYLRRVLPLYKGHGYAAVNMTEDLKPLIERMSPQLQLNLFTELHRLLAGTPISWATEITPVLNAQAEMLGEEAAEDYLTAIFRVHMTEGDGTIFGQSLEWAIKNYVQKEKEEVFGNAFARAAAGARVEDADRAGKMKAAYNKAIHAAEQARSVSAFRILSQAAAAVNPSLESRPQLEKPAEIRGVPAEHELIRLSTITEWDDATEHANIMTPRGGKSHTGEEQKPHFIVQIKEAPYLTGCVIRKADGNEYRMRKAAVYTSSDGATWFKRAETEDMPKQWNVTFPEGTSGKWVKVEFDNSARAEYAHISHFLIYCTK